MSPGEIGFLAGSTAAWILVYFLGRMLFAEQDEELKRSASIRFHLLFFIYVTSGMTYCLWSLRLTDITAFIGYISLLLVLILVTSLILQFEDLGIFVRLIVSTILVVVGVFIPMTIGSFVGYLIVVA